MGMDWVAIGAVGGAIIAAVAAVLATMKSNELVKVTENIQKHSLNTSRLALAEAMIGDHLEEILTLHGRSAEDVARLGISPAQLIYLIHSFTAGDIYYRVGNDSTLTPYRLKLLESKKVRDTWKQMLKGVFINSDGNFAKLVDSHL